MKTFNLLLIIISSVVLAQDEVPIKIGAESVYQSTPIIVDIDLRQLPIVEEWKAGDPIREIPKRYIPRAGLNANPPKPTFEEAYIDEPHKRQLIWDNNNRGSSRALSSTIIATDGSNSTGVSPPDTVGDVGIEYYIHSYNGSGGSQYIIFNKSDGSVAAGPLNMDAITPSTGNCSGGNGDPIILFDEMAAGGEGRWVLTEFTASGNAMCIYIAQTADPLTGGWFVYEFIGASFPDYPKYGVWSDAYYIGTNENSTTLYALDRNSMLAGVPATMQRFTTADLSGFGFQMIVPADHDGTIAPKAGAPGIFMRHKDDEVHSGSCTGASAGQDCLQLYDFTVDWATPSNSSLVGPVDLLVDNFNSRLCGLSSFACMEQPGTTNTLDPLREVIMWRLQYRNFEHYETLVANLETNLLADNPALGAIRWFELRRTSGTAATDWTLHQEGTWNGSPEDSTNRWMGSASMDASGNIGVAYSTSSSANNDFPSLKYAGRLATDSLGVLTSGENTIVNGGGAQLAGGNPPNTRWGDYASLSVDPVDDCTFWFSSEYVPLTSWTTHVSSFKYDECGFKVTPDDIEVCVNTNPTVAPAITIDTAYIPNFFGTVNYSISSSLPTGITSSFVPASTPAGGSSSLSLSIANTTNPGQHSLTVQATDSTVVESKNIDVFVSYPIATVPTLNIPFDGQASVSLSPTFSWSNIASASNYDIEIATDVGFSNIIDTATVSSNSYSLDISLNPLTQYYWRVKPKNSCGDGIYSSVFSFTTANITTVSFCTSPGLTIPTGTVVSDTFNIGQDITITDIDVLVDITHSYVGDLIVNVQKDTILTNATIIDRAGYTGTGFGCNVGNIDAILDDSGTSPVEDECNASSPAIGPGSFTPNNPLSVFNTKSSLGDWTLTISDTADPDDGTLNEWCVIVTGTPFVPPPDISFSGNNLSQDVCVSSSPTSTTPVTLNVTSLNNYNNPIALAFNPVPPTGISGGFSNNNFIPASATGTDSTLNMNVTNGTSPGINTVTIEASGTGISTKSVNVDLNVIFGLSTSPTLSTPLNGSLSVATNTPFTWAAISGASTYDIEISDDPGFFNIIDSAVGLATTSFTPGAALNNATFYYWRVRASNTCNSTAYTVSAFETAGGSTNSTSTTCNSSNIAIPDNSTTGVNRSITVGAPGGTISDINVTLDALHNRVSDVVVRVQKDATPATNPIIINRPGVPGSGCNNDNINTTLDDSAGVAVEGVCSSPNPAIGTGPYSPNSPLSVFNGVSSAGSWTLNISDRRNNQEGTFREWCLVATISTESPVIPADYSDLESSYGIAKHEGGGTLKLGPTWTDDSSFSQDFDDYDAMNNADGSDDGITASGLWLPNSSTAELTVESSGGYVACWFDWNNDGTFSNGEKTIAQNVTAGMVDISVTIPMTSTFGSNGDDYLESRCRFYGSEPLLINGSSNKYSSQNSNFATESATGTALSGEVEDYRFAANQLTPVTLAFTSGTQRSSGFKVDWTTTTETGTIGFNILAYSNGRWSQINNQPISANGINSVKPNDYSFQSNNQQVESYKIEELTTRGMKNTYGPFANQLNYGRAPENNTKINWQQIQAESNAKQQQRQSLLQGGFDFIKVSVSQTGVQRIGYQELLNLGVDWQNVLADDISISFENKAIARYVSGTVFGPGEYIEFIGKAANSLYTNNNVYILSVDPNTVKKQTDITSNNFVLDNSAYHMANSAIDEDLLYNFSSPDNSPWYNFSMLAYTDPKQWEFPILTSSIINNGVAANFEYNIWGGTDWPQAGIDHHVQIEINGLQITEFYGNGIDLFNDDITLDNNLLQQQNILKIILPADTGVDYDLVQLDSLSINYPAELKAENGMLQFIPIVTSGILDIIFKNSFDQISFDSGFVVKGLNQSSISAYAYDGEKLYRFAGVSAQPGLEGREVELPYVESSVFKYFVTQENQVKSPQLTLAIDTPVVLTGQYDYLMITHPDFKSALSPLVSYHQSKGLSVLVADVNDIYAQYSHHRNDANAIKTYIEQASQQMGLSAVLLVGADSYDYLDNLNIGSISYVPTLYYATDNLINFTPVDSKYVDNNDDLIPDLALGRLPVRTEQDLINIINKTLNFANRNYQQSAVFATDRNASFDDFSDQMIDLLPQNWSVDKAYINQLEFTGAQSRLINNIEAGVTLTNFFGHSGFSSWSFEHLFDTSDIMALNNTNKATVVNQFGCWNTYYVMPEIYTMADYFMQQDNKGAVAVMGASTLTESFHESKLGNLLIPKLTQSNTNIGQAILQAKQNLAAVHPDYLDVILGWTLLGDPMLEINE